MLFKSVAGQINSGSKLPLQSVLLTMPEEKGYWRKIAEFSQTQSGRLVAIFSAARVEATPNAHIAILDLNVYRSIVYGKLHTLVDGNVLKLYYKTTDVKTILYATGDTTYGRIGVSILMAYGTTFAIGASELIDESATVIQ